MQGLYRRADRTRYMNCASTGWWLARCPRPAVALAPWSLPARFTLSHIPCI